jgi:glycerol-3-phosphate dehydrogenase
MKRNLVDLSAQEYDVLIIGGGINGICVAWDAALRGLSVALVEKGDFGQATSFNSMRIIHGGFRYLQHADFRRVRRFMREQAAFMRIAPHLVHPLPFLIPTYNDFMRGRNLFRLALWAKNIIGFNPPALDDPAKVLPKGRLISRAECLQILPGLDDRRLSGAAVVYDSQMASSERVVMSFAHSAMVAGATLANYVQVTNVLRRGDRLVGAKARDVLTGDEFDIRAKIVVNTCGPWMDGVTGLLNGGFHGPRQRWSKAFNLVVNRRWGTDLAFGVYSHGSYEDKDAIFNKRARLLFITPWRERSLIGTAYLPYDCEPDNMTISKAEIETFLNEINKAFPAAELALRDVSFVYGGLVPILDDEPLSEAVQLRKKYRIHDHRTDDGIDGLISINGVKFTEARYVAERAVSLLFRRLGNSAPRCRTAETRIYGGNIERVHDFLTVQIRRNGFPAPTIRRLVYHYGTAYDNVLSYMKSSCQSQPKMNVEGRLLEAETLYALREEMGLKLEDVVLRRTSLAYESKNALDSIRFCASVMAKELGWSRSRLQKEVEQVTDLFPDLTYEPSENSCYGS